MPIEPVGSAQTGRMRQAVAVARSAEQKVDEGTKSASEALRSAGRALKRTSAIDSHLKDAVSIGAAAQNEINEGTRRAARVVESQQGAGANLDVLA